MNENRVEGMLVGLAVGDALGAPVEFGYSSGKIRDKWGEQYADHRIPAGYYTDDTAMALCLADSLLHVGGYNSYDVMSRYLKWATMGYRESTGNPAEDIGSQTSNAIEAFADSPAIAKEEIRSSSAGNGGIMRLAPALIATAEQDITTAMRLAKISSRETHFSYEADAGAELFGAMLWKALRATDKQEVVDVEAYSTDESYDGILSEIRESSDKDSEEVLRDLGGYVVDALRIAVWGFLNHENFRDGMVAVIRLGGDTDTNAAIYGQLAGAYYGYDDIPEEWLHGLYLHDEIKLVASELFDKQPYMITATRFEEDGDGLFRELYGQIE